MTLPFLIAIAAGVVVEILLLWESAGQQSTFKPRAGLLAPQLSRSQEWIGLTLLVAGLLIIVFQSSGFDPGSTILDGISSVIMLAAFSFLFLFGMVIPRLMPRVSEQTVVLVNVLILQGILPSLAHNMILLAILLIPSLLVLLLAFSDRVLLPILKSFVYLWYLICLLIMVSRNNFELFFSSDTANPSTPLEYGIAGAAGIFLLLHAIFLVRFFLMLSALVLPHNRHFMVSVMPRLFSDEQMPRLRFLIVLGLAGLLLFINQHYGFVPQLALTNVLILAVVHLMERFPLITTSRL
ncbi:MAG: hypothetical protein NT121_19150 [Chloroflexi bacterium]|nr:hypothetical protein [Chloroflexota bacterium]